MYRKILVPLDGSILAEGVLPYVRSIARAIQVPVELLQVNDRARARAYVPAVQVAQYLEKIAASFSGITDVKYTLELGNPADAIVDHAAGQPDALMPWPRMGIPGATLASRKRRREGLARTNHLLLMRSAGGDTSGEARLKTVLVPLDGSGLAEKVLSTVTNLAACLELEAVLVHVLVRFYFGSPDSFLPMFGVNIPNQQELWAQAGSEANQYLAKKVEQLRAQGLPQVSSVLIEGTAEGAAAAIVDLAKKTSDNLVALSTHGRSGIGRWLLGSVTERVVRHTNSPVIVIRPRP
jgi:nucleotide-binding universal stress UspA family protein